MVNFPSYEYICIVPVDRGFFLSLLFREISFFFVSILHNYARIDLLEVVLKKKKGKKNYDFLLKPILKSSASRKSRYLSLFSYTSDKH